MIISIISSSLKGFRFLYLEKKIGEKVSLNCGLLENYSTDPQKKLHMHNFRYIFTTTLKFKEIAPVVSE